MLKSTNEDFQVQNASLRVSVVYFNVGQEQSMEGGGQFINQDLSYSNSYIMEIVPLRREARLLAFWQLG